MKDLKSMKHNPFQLASQVFFTLNNCCHNGGHKCPVESLNILLAIGKETARELRVHGFESLSPSLFFHS